MSSAVILGANQHDPHLLATKDVKDDHLTDNWTPIPNVNDPYVQGIAKFAVTEHNKEAKDDLKYKRVISGWTREFVGIQYRLIIEATRDYLLPIREGLYEAIVWESVGDPVIRKLGSFEPMVLKN